MKLQDSEAFERAFTQLRPLYDDASLSVSPKRNLCLGLNLMRLLADNQLWQFHSQVRGMGDEQTVVCVCVSVPSLSSCGKQHSYTHHVVETLVKKLSATPCVCVTCHASRGAPPRSVCA